MSDTVTVEISGPLIAVMQQQVAQSGKDCLGLMFGVVNKCERYEASDSVTASQVTRTCLQIKNFIIIDEDNEDLDDVIDYKKGVVKKDKIDLLWKKRIESLGEEFLGLFRFRY